MEAQFWIERWAEGRIGFHRDSVNDALVEHWSSLCPRGAGRVLVPLCGKSVDLHWLAERNGEVVGVEIAQQAVDEFWHDAQLEPTITKAGSYVTYRYANLTIMCGSFFDLNVENAGRFDAFYDRASLVALPPAMRANYRIALERVTTTGARGLVLTFEYDETIVDGPPFSIDGDRLKALLDVHFAIDVVKTEDLITRSDRFRERGLDSFVRRVSTLTRR